MSLLYRRGHPRPFPLRLHLPQHWSGCCPALPRPFCCTPAGKHSNIAPQPHSPIRAGTSHKRQLPMTRHANHPFTGLLPVALAILYRCPLVEIPYTKQTVGRAGEERVGRGSGDAEASDGRGMCLDGMFGRCTCYDRQFWSCHLASDLHLRASQRRTTPSSYPARMTGQVGWHRTALTRLSPVH